MVIRKRRRGRKRLGPSLVHFRISLPLVGAGCPVATEFTPAQHRLSAAENHQSHLPVRRPERLGADAGVVAAIEALVRDAPDSVLNRVNLFDLSWNVLCPGCGGVLDANTSLKTVHEDAYTCALCGAGYEPTLDEMVEVSFTVNPRVRRIAAHDPHSLPMWEYQRQIFWSTGLDLPENIEDILAEIVFDSIELPPAERASLSLQLPQQFVIVFEPVTHSAQFLDVKGEPTLPFLVHGKTSTCDKMMEHETKSQIWGWYRRQISKGECLD